MLFFCKLKLNDYDESTTEMKQNVLGFIRDIKNKKEKIGAIIMDFELIGFKQKRKKDNLATEHAMTIIKCGIDNNTCKFRVVQSFEDVFSLNEYKMFLKIGSCACANSGRKNKNKIFLKTFWVFLA